MNPRDWEWPEWLVAGIVTFIVIVLTAVIWQEVTEPDEGEVTGKEHHGSYWTTNCTTVNNRTNCTQIYHPECWEIMYRGGGDTGNDCVDKTRWENIRLGDWYRK